MAIVDNLNAQVSTLIAERNALQQSIASKDNVDIVKFLQEKLARYESVGGNDVESLKTQLVSAQKRTAALEEELKTAKSESAGLLPSKVNQNESYYIISSSDAEALSKRIKKLQTELWNLETKHQQLQETHAHGHRPSVASGDDRDTAQLRDALKREKEQSVLVVTRYKELVDAILELKDDAKNAVENASGAEKTILQSVVALSQRALEGSDDVLAPPELRVGSVNAGDRTRVASKSKADAEKERAAASSSSSPLLVQAVAHGKDTTKRGSTTPSRKKDDKEKEKDKEKDKADRRSKVKVTGAQ